MQQAFAAQDSGGGPSVLLQSIAEQLTSPLTIISREAELAQLGQAGTKVNAQHIHAQATAALTLVESYLLGLQLSSDQAMLTLEPVSVASLLVDAAHELDGFAKQYNTELRVSVAGRYEPVMAHAGGLRAVLLALGYALLESYGASDKRSLTLAVHRTPHGIVTGLYGSFEQISSDRWRRALGIQGKAVQSFVGLCKGSGAGLFVADAILQAMSTRLRVGRHNNERGLATTLQPSQQLLFV